METANLTAGGHALPADWLGRIALIWSGYAVALGLSKSVRKLDAASPGRPAAEQTP